MKLECGRLFDLKGDDLKRHEFRTVAYGHNSHQLAVKPGDETQTLSEAGVTHRSLLLLTAPVDLKPVRQFEVKKKDGEEEEEDVVGGFSVLLLFLLHSRRLWSVGRTMISTKV